VSGGVLVRPFKWSLTAAIIAVPLGIGDTVNLVQLAMGDAPGFVLIGFDIEVPDIDSATGVVLTIGDSTDPARFMDTTQTGTAGRVAARLFSMDSNLSGGGAIVGSLPVKYTAQDDLIMTFSAAPTTGVAGVFKGFLIYTQLGETSVGT